MPVGDPLGRPVAVVEVVPDRHVVVEGDGPRDLQPGDGLLHVAMVLLEVELRRVDAHDDEPVLLVPVPPRPHVGQRADAVDTGVRPEVVDDDLAGEILGGERRRVEPSLGVERGDGRADRELVDVDGGDRLRRVGLGGDPHGDHRQHHDAGGGPQIPPPGGPLRPGLFRTGPVPAVHTSDHRGWTARRRPPPGEFTES